MPDMPVRVDATAVLDEGRTALSYSSVIGPDVLDTDAGLILAAANTVGRDRVTNRDLREYLETGENHERGA
jgi:hypothetical protein